MSKSKIFPIIIFISLLFFSASVFAQITPIASYGFDQGGGTTAPDSSGSGRTGTLENGPIWTTGKFGTGISFSGNNDVVTLPSDNPRTEMTVEAWINISSYSGTGSFGSIFKIENSLTPRTFFNIRNTGASGAKRFEAGWNTSAGGAATPYWNLPAGPITLNNWHHIAVTYNSSSRGAPIFYVDGVRYNPTGSNMNSAFMKDLASWTIGSKFKGTIDEVRIYDRILSQAEIQTDMNLPIGLSFPSGGDTLPPLRLNKFPSGNLSAGTTQTTIGLDTDEVAECRYSMSSGTNFSVMTNIFSTSDGLSHTANVNGLANGNMYIYYVKCRDISGNANTGDVVIIFSISMPGNTAPSVSAGSDQSTILGIPINLDGTVSDDGLPNSIITITWSMTNGPGIVFFGNANSVDTTANFSAAGTYVLRITASDGLLSSFDEILAIVNPPADTQAPSTPTNLQATPLSTTQIGLSWTGSTDNVGVVGYRIYRCAGNGCTPTVQIGTSATNSYSDSGLTQNTTYTYAVSAYDAANNEGSKSSSVSATTQTPVSIGQNYTTNFPLTENPISEGGIWTNGNSTGIDWSNVQTTPGLAFATKFNVGPPYDDSLAILSGFTPDQSAEGVVYRANGYSPTANHEVELLLRFSITPNNAHGYEVIWQSNGGYSQVVRWNGPLNSYTVILSSANLGTPVNGDVIKATVIGNNISVYKNGVLRSTVTDTTWTTGNPGIGFWARQGATLQNYGWSSFTANGISSTVVNQSPSIVSVSANPTNGQSPLDVSFTASATDPENDPLIYSWDFGDNQSSNQKDVFHTYSVDGIYNAKLTVSDSINQVSSNTIQIVVGTQPAPTGLIGAWNFNEGTGSTTSDSSGNGKTGTLTNGPVWVTGKYGNGLRFDGVNDVVTLPSANVPSAMTIEAWVNSTTMTGQNNIFSIRDIIDQKPYVVLRGTGTTGALRYEAGWLTGTGTVVIPYWNSPALVTNNQWHHVAITYNSSSGNIAKFYIDGVAVTTTKGASSASGTFITDPFQWTIGNTIGAASAATFNGVIDEVRVYNRALTQAEIQSDMNTPVL